jgi:hypothetical protein
MARTAGLKKRKVGAPEEKEAIPDTIPEPSPEELDQVEERSEIIQAANAIIRPIVDKLRLYQQDEVDLSSFSEEALWARARWLHRLNNALGEAGLDTFGLSSALRCVNDELVRHHVRSYPRFRLSTDRLKCYKCGSEQVVRLRAPYHYDGYHDKRPLLPRAHFIADLQCRACKAKSHTHELPQEDQYMIRPGKGDVGGGKCYLCGVETSDYESNENLAQAFARDRHNKPIS